VLRILLGVRGFKVVVVVVVVDDTVVCSMFINGAGNSLTKLSSFADDPGNFPMTILQQSSNLL